MFPDHYGSDYDAEAAQVYTPPQRTRLPFVVCRSCGRDDAAVNQSTCRCCGSDDLKRFGGR